jgi:hypothetical protein
MNNFNIKEFIKTLFTKDIFLKLFSVFIAIFIFIIISK